MSQTETRLLSKRWTAIELMTLPPEQRDEILQAAAAAAEREYQSQSELTAFEAFGTRDRYGDSANTEARRNMAD